MISQIPFTPSKFYGPIKKHMIPDYANSRNYGVDLATGKTIMMDDNGCYWYDTGKTNLRAWYQRHRAKQSEGGGR